MLRISALGRHKSFGHASIQRRTHAHRTGFQGHIQLTTFEPPRAQGRSRRGDRQHLGVCRRVLEAFAGIAPAATRPSCTTTAPTGTSPSVPASSASCRAICINKPTTGSWAVVNLPCGLKPEGPSHERRFKSVSKLLFVGKTCVLTSSTLALMTLTAHRLAMPRLAIGDQAHLELFLSPTIKTLTDSLASPIKLHNSSIAIPMPMLSSSGMPMRLARPSANAFKPGATAHQAAA